MQMGQNSNKTKSKCDKLQKGQNAKETECKQEKKQMGRNTNKAPPKYKCTKTQMRQNAKRQLRQNTNWRVYGNFYKQISITSKEELDWTGPQILICSTLRVGLFTPSSVRQQQQQLTLLCSSLDFFHFDINTDTTLHQWTVLPISRQLIQTPRIIILSKQILQYESRRLYCVYIDV